MFWSESGRVELEKQALGLRACAKSNFSQVPGFCLCSGMVDIILLHWEDLSWFLVLGNRIEIH